MTKDSNHPFFRPLWRRITVVAFCVAWAIFEFATGTPFWGIIALGFAGYGVWQFIIVYDASEPVPPADVNAEKE